MNLYDKVAARCAAAEIPVSATCVRDIERYLKEERRAAAYDRAGVPMARPCEVRPGFTSIDAGGCAPPVFVRDEGQP